MLAKRKFRAKQIDVVTVARHRLAAHVKKLLVSNQRDSSLAMRTRETHAKVSHLTSKRAAKNSSTESPVRGKKNVTDSEQTVVVVQQNLDYAEEIAMESDTRRMQTVMRMINEPTERKLGQFALHQTVPETKQQFLLLVAVLKEEERAAKEYKLTFRAREYVSYKRFLGKMRSVRAVKNFVMAAQARVT